MAPPEFSDFEKILLTSPNELGASIMLLLCWIAVADGIISDNEYKELSHISNATKHGSEFDSLLHIAQAPKLRDLQLACEHVQRNTDFQQRQLFIEMCIGMALVDGYLTTSENHIIRFLADVVSIDTGLLYELFRSNTGKSLPEPSDLSRASWWEKRKKAKSENGSRRASSAAGNKGDIKIIKALAVLGLDEGATSEEIKKAYRRMAQVHHPDRYVSLGEEAVEAAKVTFQRIQEAYDFLKNNA